MLRLLRALCLILLLALPASAQVSVTGGTSTTGTVSYGAGGGGGGGGIAFDTAVQFNLVAGGPYTQAMTITGANTYLACATADADHSGNTISGITYNSVALSSLASQTDGFGSSTTLWRLIAPATGTHNVVVTYSAQAHNGYAQCVSYTGVHQTTPEGTPVTVTGSSSSPSVTVTLGAGEWALGTFVQAGSNTLTISAGTNRVADGSGTASQATGDNTTGTVSYSSTFNGDWAGIGVNLKPAP